VTTADQLTHLRSLSAQFDPEANDFIRVSGENNLNAHPLNSSIGALSILHVILPTNLPNCGTILSFTTLLGDILSRLKSAI
jgi:hypothetical protein